jgi:hypothetical protein
MMYKLQSVTNSKCAVSPLERSVSLPCLGKESRLLLSAYYVVGMLDFSAKTNSDHCALNG